MEMPFKLIPDTGIFKVIMSSKHETVMCLDRGLPCLVIEGAIGKIRELLKEQKRAENSPASAPSPPTLSVFPKTEKSEMT